MREPRPGCTSPAGRGVGSEKRRSSRQKAAAMTAKRSVENAATAATRTRLASIDRPPMSRRLEAEIASFNRDHNRVEGAHVFDESTNRSGLNLRTAWNCRHSSANERAGRGGGAVTRQLGPASDARRAGHAVPIRRLCASNVFGVQRLIRELVMTTSRPSRVGAPARVRSVQRPLRRRIIARRERRHPSRRTPCAAVWACPDRGRARDGGQE